MNLVKVLSGGNYDVDAVITDKNGRILQSWQKEKQGDLTITPPEGEVGVCFSNGMASFAAKTIEFELLTRHKNEASQLYF